MIFPAPNRFYDTLLGVDATGAVRRPSVGDQERTNVSMGAVEALVRDGAMAKVALTIRRIERHCRSTFQVESVQR